MDLYIPVWSIYLGVFIAVWGIVLLWPSETDNRPDPYGAGKFITAMIRICVGLTITVILVLFWGFSR